MRNCLLIILFFYSSFCFSQEKIKLSKECNKSIENANPISPVRFCADPTAVEYEGRLYVYGTSDHQQFEFAGLNGKNTYDKIKSLEVFSTDDMVNWEYHGVIDVKTVAPWIMNSWAPSICSRKESDGLTHFYLYFSNNGTGVGVITATNPLGPWSDPLGKPLIKTGMPKIGDVPNPFDPGVCIDDRGVGWLAFGGGTAKNGSEALPRSSRIARLGSDMVSIDTVAEILAPYFFEASELNFINGTYVYTYNNNWVPRTDWNYKIGPEPSQCSMSYMTTKTPLETDSWTYRGHYFQNPGDQGLCYSNNHTHLTKYNGKYYLLYHTMALHQALTGRNDNLSFRSLCVDEAKVDEEKVKISMVKGSLKGVEPNFVEKNFSSTNRATMATGAGIVIDTVGGMPSIRSTEVGAWILIRQLPSSSEYLYELQLYAEGQGSIEIRLDKLKSDAIYTYTIEKDKKRVESFRFKIEGEHDLYLVFSEKDICLKKWWFTKAEKVSE